MSQPHTVSRFHGRAGAVLVLAGLSLVILATALAALPGCGESVFAPKPAVAPQVVYCFDTVGHRSGAKPWLLGGTCCCTPAETVLADWHAHGYFTGQSVTEVIDLYHQKGVKLAVDHSDCNNCCPDGPHVVKGGHCMVPPTPGTENYEEVLFGKVYVTKDKAPKDFQTAVPSGEAAYTAAGPKAATK
jgi:hypothetical protein